MSLKLSWFGIPLLRGHAGTHPLSWWSSWTPRVSRHHRCVLNPEALNSQKTCPNHPNCAISFGVPFLNSEGELSGIDKRGSESKGPVGRYTPVKGFRASEEGLGLRV